MRFAPPVRHTAAVVTLLAACTAPPDDHQPGPEADPEADRAAVAPIPRDRLSALVFFLHSSAAHLLVTDPSGRRTGMDPITGRSYSQIPNAFYGSNEIDDLTDDEPTATDVSREFTRIRPGDGDYVITVTGTDEGTYDLELRTYDRTGALSRTGLSDIPTRPGMVHTFELSYSATAPPGGRSD